MAETRVDESTINKDSGRRQVSDNQQQNLYRIQRLGVFWSRFRASRPGRFLILAVRILIPIAILALLAYEVLNVGWSDVLSNPPASPFFYLLFLLLYFLLPATEVVIYRRIFDFDVLRSFPTFIRKRILNRDVLGYSGEVFFFSWARGNLEVGRRRLAETIRDNNILSAAASTTVAAVLLAVFLAEGDVSIGELTGGRPALYLVVALVFAAILMPVVVRFRRYIFTMSARTASLIFSIQIARLLIGQALQIGMWAVVIPEVGLSVWFTFAAVSIVMTRIPFMTNHAVLFAGVGIALAAEMGVPEAPWAGLLLVTAALDKLLNLVLFAWISARESVAVTPETRIRDDGRGESVFDPGNESDAL